MKKLISIILMLIMYFPVNIEIAQSANYSSPNSTDPQYLIIKVDDIGGDLNTWLWFYNVIQSDSRFKADIGIMGDRLLPYPEHEQYIKNNILNNPQFGIFNHGWDHNIPEFENRSYDYMYSHIAFWDNYMKATFNYDPSVKILGAPGNAIGNVKDCSLDLYTILAQLNYKLLYFSYCKPDPTGPTAGGNLGYIYFENNLKPRSLPDILNDFKNLNNYKFLYTQIHPTIAWNTSYLTYVLDNVFSSTHRTSLKTADYYTYFFLPTYPNYFLANPAEFLKNRSNVEDIKITPQQYQNSLLRPQAAKPSLLDISGCSINDIDSNCITLTLNNSASAYSLTFSPMVFGIVISFPIIFKRIKHKKKVQKELQEEI